MTLLQLIDDIITEVSYRTTTGIPDFSNPDHINILEEVLYEMQVPQFTQIIANLTETSIPRATGEKSDAYDTEDLNTVITYQTDPDNPEDSKEKSAAVGDLLKGKQGPGYEAAMRFLGSRGIDVKDTGGVADADDIEGPSDADDRTGPSADQPDPPGDEEAERRARTKAMYDNDPVIQKRLEKEKEIQNQMASDMDDGDLVDVESYNLSPEGETNLKDFEKRTKDFINDLSDKQKELMNQGLERIAVLYSEDRSDEEKEEAAEWVVKNLKFSTNTNGKKAYLNALGGNRKIISGNAGTKKSEDLVQKISQYADVSQYNARSVSQALSTAAKPNLGDDYAFQAADDPELEQFFSGNSTLNKIKKSMWGVYGVKDSTGKLKRPSSKYAKEYLRQSFENPALENTINTAQELVDGGKIDQGVVSALEGHRARLDEILEKFDAPSEEASEAIAETYNTMMVELHIADSDVASSIMKQLAENRLYEQELARGHEVYLPVHGSFPGGDIIKVDGIERVSLISCKFGKSGRTYGCPANAKAVTGFHPNEAKREKQGQYIGEDGYTLMVNDKLVRGDTAEASIEKTREFMRSTLTEVGLATTFTDEEYNEIANLTTEYMEFIDEIKQDIEGITPAKLYWKNFNDRLSEKENEFQDRMGSIITEEHVTAIIGKNNVGNVINTKGQVKPESVLSMIEIANNIRTSDGYGLTHNKQYYTDSGEPSYVTDDGTTNPDDYSITFRTKRTAGRAGGGCQISYTGDADVDIDISITDDGGTFDPQTAEPVEPI